MASDELGAFFRRGLNAQRAADAVIQANGGKDQNAPTGKALPHRRTLKKRNLKNGLSVHWRTDKAGYESIMRQIFDESKGQDTLSDAERKRWFKRGWQKRLEQRRAKHRRAGIPDSNFLHPSLK